MAFKGLIDMKGHKTGPNSWKVAFILEELGLPYEHKFLDLAEMKEEPYERLNPNGRVPTIEDPNSGLTIWESGACIDYLVETYDKTGELTPHDTATKWSARSWRDFQVSGQGPSFGQYSWFINYHPEDLPSAKDRYKNEVLRIMTVMDKQLSKTEYLAGDRLTYVDLMWIPYFIVAFKIPEQNFAEKFPSWNAWWQRVGERPAVKKVWGEWMTAREQAGKKAS